MLKTIVIAAGLLAAIVVVAQNPSSSERIDVTLVTLDVMVSDAGGRPVTDLTRQDFQIFEDGLPQEIRTFTPVESPYSIVLLIDRSRSMENHWPLMEPAIARFVSNLRPQDRISIGAFDERSQNVELLLDWRTAENGSSIQVGINPVTTGNPYVIAGGGSFSVRAPVKNFYGSLDWSMQRLASVGGRKGVLVFTDGRQPGAPTKRTTVDGVMYVYLVDAQDDGDFKKLLRRVQGSEARFDFVAVNTDLNPAGDPFRGSELFNNFPLTFGMSVRSRLEQLATNSGGRVALPKRPEETVKLYENIAQELGTSYTLGYSPAAATLKDGRYHRVEVRSTRQGLSVRQSRDGYTGQ
jgi:VWFA-related protein